MRCVRAVKNRPSNLEMVQTIFAIFPRKLEAKWLFCHTSLPRRGQSIFLLIERLSRFLCPGILLAPLRGSAPHQNAREKENLWENQHESLQSNANKDTLCLSTRGKKSMSPEHMWKKKRGIFIEFPGSC
jgi:hypothetical protein